MKPGRADRYESQLTDKELVDFHHVLMSGKVTLEKIRDTAPKWREGKFAGKPPSMGLLSTIRERLVLEEEFRANEETAETIEQEIARQNPNISKAQIDEIGQRTFKLLCLRRQDVKGWVDLQKAEKDKASHELARERFEVATCEKFLKWFEDQAAREIATGTLGNTEKIAQLRALMFRDLAETPEAA